MTNRIRKAANPELFARMSAPFDTLDEANDALSAFFEDVSAAREKHRIKNVVVIAEIATRDADGERPGAASFSCGDVSAVLPMVARKYGEEREAFEQLIDGMQKDGRESVRRRR
jgi:hypothetical protein